MNSQNRLTNATSTASTISTISMSLVARNSRPCVDSHSWQATPPISTNAFRYSAKCSRKRSSPRIIGGAFRSEVESLSVRAHLRIREDSDTTNKDRLHRSLRVPRDRISTTPFAHPPPQGLRTREGHPFQVHPSM